MISIEGLSVAFGGNTLFDNITYVINKKDRIGGEKWCGEIDYVENHSRVAGSDIG